MRPTRLLRPVALVAVLLAMSVLPGLTPTADATSRGSIVLHPRICPVEIRPGDSLFDRCHGSPGPEGVTFKIDTRQSKAIDGRGNVSFGRVTAGDHLVVLTTVYQPNEFLRLRAYCTNFYPDGSSSGPNEATIRSTEQASFYVRVGAGAQLICDVYFIPISGRG